MVIEPLDRIGQKALLISEHSEHLGEQIKLPAFKEMQKLTEAFNTMSTALKKERDYLEQRVQERTAELEKVKERIQHIATHDALTELPNRRLFEEQFSQAVKLAKRNQDEFSLMMIDLDDFKEINDTYGHVTGDKVLKQFGKRMENILRDSDLVARWGGDEFIILLFNTSKEADMISVVEKVFSTIETPISADKIKLILKMSAGIARYPQDGETEDKLLRHADYALYEAKAQPGNSYHFYRDITSDSSNL
jgi:diguanylate cyclase (GGDEF)-like protein